jgi:hypothetical protein
MLSEAELLTLKGRYTLTLPLPNHAAARNRLLARGRAQDFQTLQQHYPAVPAKIQQKLSEGQQGSGWDTEHYTQARMVLTHLQQTGKGAEQHKFEDLLLQLKQLGPVGPGLSVADKTALQTQLLDLCESAAAACNQGQPNIGVAQLLSMLWVQATFIGDLSSAASDPKRHQWYLYAEAQVYIQDAASTPQAAQLLLGPDAIEAEHLR